LFYLYFALKDKIRSALTKKIGLGDLFFIIAICFLIPPLTFIVFYILSLILSLLLYGLTYFIFKQAIFTGKAIPLAGLQSFFLFIFIITLVILGNLNLNIDNFILNKLLHL